MAPEYAEAEQEEETGHDKRSPGQRSAPDPFAAFLGGGVESAKPRLGEMRSVSMLRRKYDRVSPKGRRVGVSAFKPKEPASSPTSRSMGEPSWVADVK